MRCLSLAVFLSTASFPLGAAAHPFAPGSLFQPAEDSTDVPEVDTSPTSSKAPDSVAQPVSEPEPEPEPEPEAEPEPEGPVDEQTGEIEDPTTTEESLQEEREKVQEQQGGFNPHGVGARGGITVIPTWILNSFLSSHGNALCRGGNIGTFAADRGLLKQDGCNFYAGGEYVYRKSRIFDIVAAVGYQHAHAPDSYWLDNSEWDPDSCTTHDGDQCNLAAADYTEVKLGVVFLEADFIARAPVVITKDVELGIGGGAGIGLGIVTGGVWQTAIGSAPGGRPPGGTPAPTCNTLQDLADFTRCTPRWDATEETNDPDFVFDPAELSEPNPLNYARCTKDKCDTGDLKAFGYRKKQADIPPVVPVVNLIVSARLIVKDVFGVTLTGGFNTGFYFGGNLTYFFGKKGANKKSGPAGPAARRKAPRFGGGRGFGLL